MMKNQKFLCLLGICLLFAACQDMLQPSNPADDGFADGKAAVSIVVLDAVPRTVLPQVSLADVTGFTLRGSLNGGGEAEPASFSSTTGNQVYLEPGTWNFTLNAYKDADLILQGQVENKVIALSGGNTVTFQLSPLESGQGSISVTVDYPAIISRVEASLDGTAIDGGRLTFTNTAGNRVLYTETKAAGSYVIVFKFYDAANTLRGTVSELILVRGNVSSAKSIVLGEADLKGE